MRVNKQQISEILRNVTSCSFVHGHIMDHTRLGTSLKSVSGNSLGCRNKVLLIPLGAILDSLTREMAILRIHNAFQFKIGVLK